jgi:hypothetical protein
MEIIQALNKHISNGHTEVALKSLAEASNMYKEHKAKSHS